MTVGAGKPGGWILTAVAGVVLLFGAAAVAGAQAGAQAGAGTGATVGSVAPRIVLPALAGEPVDLARYLGRTPVVIHFWAAWCPQCRQQMPSLKAAIGRYGRDVKFIGVAVSANHSIERARRYAAAHHMTHELLYDARGDAVTRFDVPTTSYVVVIDRRGRIVFTGSGPDLDIVAAAARVAPAARQRS